MTQHRFTTLTKLIVLVSLIVFSQIGFSAQVVGVKGKKLLVNLQGEPAQKGDLFYLLNSAGKKKGILKIMKIKGNKALALLGKGRAKKGYTLQYRPKKSGSARKRKGSKGKAMAKSSSSGSSASGAQDSYWGIIAGFSQNSMNVKLKDDTGADRDEVSMSGNGFSAKGLLDYKLLNNVWFRGMGGIEQFSTAGEELCGDSSPFEDACTTDIMYFALDLWGRYVITEGSFRPWVGAGFTLLVPLSKSSSALDEESVTNTSVMSAGFGFDYFTSPSFYIPFQVEYGLLPSSEDVTANIIAVRVGAGFSF
ncbi:MAG: outer membrane beta-barrel protein [Bdellovibrionales bacterium]|nr:outer membrane beta-barrel protein [Bdellovibrionales bacterium]